MVLTISRILSAGQREQGARAERVEQSSNGEGFVVLPGEQCGRTGETEGGRWQAPADCGHQDEPAFQ